MPNYAIKQMGEDPIYLEISDLELTTTTSVSTITEKIVRLESRSPDVINLGFLEENEKFEGRGAYFSIKNGELLLQKSTYDDFILVFRKRLPESTHSASSKNFSHPESENKIRN